MGTRADFYIGTGATAVWLGSIAWDGYPDGDCRVIKDAESEAGFRNLAAGIIKREDGTTPDQGWPWPWPDSHTTDYAYCWTDKGGVKVFCFGRPVDKPWSKNSDDGEGNPKADFPNMEGVQNITFGERSGIMLIQAKPGAGQ